MKFLNRFFILAVGAIVVLLFTREFWENIFSQKHFFVSKNFFPSSQSSANKLNSKNKIEASKLEDKFGNLFQQIPQKEANEIEKVFTDKTSKEIETVALSFDKIISEIDKEIMKKNSLLLKNIVVDKNKKDVIYLNEVQPLLQSAGEIRINFYDNQNLLKTSGFFEGKARFLARIKPSLNFEGFHIFWIINFSSKAHLLKKLSTESNVEQRYALLNILKTLVEAEDTMIQKYAP
jgi:hypothetical protein